MIARTARYFSYKLKDLELRELLTRSASSFLLAAAGMAMGYAFTLLIARSLGAEILGIYSIAITVLNVTATLGRLGMDKSLVRFVAEYSVQNKQALLNDFYFKSAGLAIVFSTVISISLFFGSSYLAVHLFKNQQIAKALQLVSLAVVPLAYLFINGEALRGLKKVAEYSFLVFLSAFLFAFFILAALLPFFRTSYVAVLSYVVGAGFASILSLSLWLKHSKFSLGNRKFSMGLADMLNISIPMLLSNMLVYTMHWMDTIMLGMFRTEAEVGIYNVALRIAHFTAIALLAFNSFTAPKFAESFGKGDVEGLRRTVSQSSKLIFWTSFPILMAVFLFPSQIMAIFGKEFHGGSQALVLLTLGQLVNILSGSVAFLLQMTGRHKAVRNIALVAAIINIVLNYLLIPRYGINGAAISSMVAVAFWNLASVVYAKISMDIMTMYIPFLTRSSLKV